MAGARYGEHLSDILAETAGKLERLIIELTRPGRNWTSELGQNRNNRQRAEYGDDRVDEHVGRLSFARAEPPRR